MSTLTVKKRLSSVATAALMSVLPTLVFAQEDRQCADLPSHGDLRSALRAVVGAGGSGGLGFNMWATIVNRDGQVCAIAFSGNDRGDQWPGSRIISAQKASTANAFSLPGFALSTANLYAATQPGGRLFGLQLSNPVDPQAAYAGPSHNFGQAYDPIAGRTIGGINVFGGGLALYNSFGRLLGGLGVSGDTSCTDHIVAWKVRDTLRLDYVPGGVAPGGPAGGASDNILHDITRDTQSGSASSASGFGHPRCDEGAAGIATQLTSTHPLERRR
jgi:uncharacterized protein GlcG (DUF336 family)